VCFTGRRWRTCLCFCFCHGFGRGLIGARLHRLRRDFLRWRRRFLFRRELLVRNIAAQQPAQPDRHVFVDGAGVRLLFGDAQFGQPVQDLVSLDFELPGQLVDANLLHRKNLLSLTA